MAALVFTDLSSSWIFQRILLRETWAILDGGLCVWGLDRCYPLFKCILISAGLFLLCFLFSWPECGDLSPVPQISLCPQAVINYRHVSSAQTPPSLPPLCDTGHIIILTSSKNASAILVLEEFLLLPSVSRLYQASLWWRLTLNAQNRKENTHLWWKCCCFLFPLRTTRGWEHVRIYRELADTINPV